MKPRLIKNASLLAALALFAFTGDRAKAAPDTQYDHNDLLLFFLNPTGTTGTDLVFQYSLGSVQNVFRAAATPSDPTYGTTFYLGNIGANLTAAYGPDWTSLTANSSIFAGAQGQAGSTSALSSAFTNNDFARTVYITKRRSGPGTLGAPNSPLGFYPSGSTSLASEISGTNNPMVGLQGVAMTNNATLLDNYNVFSPFPDTPGTAYGIIMGGIVGRLSNSTYTLGSISNIVLGLDLYRATPSTNTNPNHWHVLNSIPATGVVSGTTSHYLGTITLSSDGSVNFIAVPEPSTYALLITGLIAAAFAARRKAIKA